MREDLERLLELQKIDVALIEAAWEADDLPPRIAELEGQLTSADAMVTEAEESMQQATKDRLRLEGDLRDQGAKLEELKAKQLAIKTNAEYAALTHEIEFMRKTISETEDVVLKMLEDVDVKSAELDERKSAADGARGEVENQIADLKGELEELREYVTLKNDERTRVAMHLDDRLLLRYERILSSKGDSAIVPLVDGVCTGCYKRLPPQAAIEISAATGSSSVTAAGASFIGRKPARMSRREADLLGGIIAGLHWRDAAARVGLSEDRALSFLESVKRFASSVGTVSEFGTVEAPGCDCADTLQSGGSPTAEGSKRESGSRLVV